MAISTPVESMPSSADFEFDFRVPSVFANEIGTHKILCFRRLLMSTLRLDCCVLSNLCIRRLSAFTTFFTVPVVLTKDLYRFENVLEFCLFIGEKKGMFLSTMRVDTYFLTSSAPRVFAVRRASSMSYVATSSHNNKKLHIC